MNLGSIYKDLENLDQALASTLKSLELKPDNHIALMNLGAIYLDLRLYENALKATLESINIQPNNSSSYVNLCEAYRKLDKNPKAIEAINLAIKLDAQNAHAHMIKGYISLEAGEAEKAEKFLLESIKLDKKSSASYRYLSIALYLKGDHQSSIKCIDNAVNINPNCRQCKEVRAILIGKLRDAQLASTSGAGPKSTRIERQHFPIVLTRPVEKGLVESLYRLDYLDLEKRNLPTKGNAKTSSFSFFEENEQIVHFLKQDLISLVREAIGTDIYFCASCLLY